MCVRACVCACLCVCVLVCVRARACVCLCVIIWELLDTLTYFDETWHECFLWPQLVTEKKEGLNLLHVVAATGIFRHFE